MYVSMDNEFSSLRPNETLDTLFAGSVSVIQGRRGYRFSLDSILLSRFVETKGAVRIADLGAGSAVIALALATLHARVQIFGLEIQQAMVERGRRSVRRNGLEGRVTIVKGDVRRIEESFAPRSFELVVCNPPYRRPESGRTSSDPERLVARHEIKGGLMDFVRAGDYLLGHGGRMCFVYPCVRELDLLCAMRNSRIEPKRMQFIYSFPDTAATLVLVEGVKGGKVGLEVLKPLTIYERKQVYTDEMARMLQG